MQDKTPTSHDSLSHLPPQGFFDEQEAMAKLVPIADELVALVQKARAPQCLHQIQEPSAAEQAAWHAGLDEGRAQAARPVVVPDDMPSTEANTKYGESYGVDWVYEGKTAAPAAVAEHGSREERMVVLKRGNDGIPTVWCDPEIADIVGALNSGGVKTVASCSGHGEKPGGIALADGRQLLLLNSLDAFNSAISTLCPSASALAAVAVPDAEYGATEFGWTFAGIQLEEGDKRLMAMLVNALGSDHPAIVDLDALIRRSRLGRAALAATPAAAPVVLPEPDAVISEVMGLVDEWGMESHLRGAAELDAQHSEATQEEIDCAKDRASKERAAWKAIESKLRALLATSTRLVLDYPWRDRLLDGRELVRDQQGFAEHSELPLLDEGMKPRAFFAALDVEMKHTMAEDDLTMDEYDAMNDAENWSAWTPRPPIGDGWNLVAIFDTEDGPAAWWARAQETMPPAAQDAREFWGVIAPCGEGVFFNNEADARWTQTGHGSGSDGFGVPTIGEAFRESYEDDALDLVRVHIVAAPTAKGK